VIGLAAPFATSLALATVIGALLLATGIIQMIHAVRFAESPGRVSNFLFAVLAVVGGALILRSPVLGASSVTAVIAFYLLLGGCSKLMLAIDVNPMKGSGFLFVSSLISLLLGVVLIVTFPVTSLFVPGIFFGVDLLVVGGAMLGFGISLRKSDETLHTIETRREDKAIVNDRRAA
jgi:uncharacterized membrane protein HdeD (DUF308 family)